MTLFKLKLKSEFFRNVFTLMTGNVIGQVIVVAIAPILSRLYTPEEFGTLALFLSITGLISVVAAGRYELAIVLPENNKNAVNVFALSLILAFITGILAIILMILLNKGITNIFNNHSISSWLYFIPILVILVGLNQSCYYWFNRNKKYNILATSKIIQSSATGSVNLGMGFLNFGVAGLILGRVFGQLFSSGFLTWKFLSQNKKDLTQIDKTTIVTQAKKYNKFPRINAIHALTDNLNADGTILLITYLFSATITGYFFFMMRMLKTPLSLAGTSISQVFYQKASEIYNKTQNIRFLVRQLLVKLILIALVPFLIILVAGPEVFEFVFGEEWKIAGEYAQILCPYTFMHFIITPLAFIPFIANKQKVAFWFGLSGNMTFLASIFLSSLLYNDIKPGLYFISIAFIVYFIIYIFWIFRISKREDDIS